MPAAEVLAILMVVAVCGALFFGYPVALTLGGVSLGFAVLGHIAGAISFSFLGALPQRIYGVMTNEVLLAIPLFIFMGVMLERSRIAEELLETMAPSVRRVARRPRHLGRNRRHLARRSQGRGRRHHRDDGPDRAADHAAPWLRQAARRRHRRRHRDLGADFPAGHRAGAARRPALHRLPGGAAPAGQFRAIVGDGQRPVRRRAHSGLRAGRALHPLSDRYGGVLSADLAGDPARSDRPAGPRAGAALDRSAGCAAASHPRRAGLDPRRHRHTNRGRFGRSGRRDPAGGDQGHARRGAGAGGAADNASHLHDLRHLDRRHHVQPRLPRPRRRRHGAPRAGEPSRRRRRRHPCRHAGDVPARLRDGRLRDHLRGGADRRGSADGRPQGRSGLARHHDGDEPADLLHAPAARPDAVFPPRRRPAGDHHPRHLHRHHPLRADPAFRPGGAVVRAGACDRAATWLYGGR